MKQIAIRLVACFRAGARGALRTGRRDADAPNSPGSPTCEPAVAARSLRA
jgi:hypothetical protein